MGLSDWYNSGAITSPSGQSPYEKLILGAIMFIPGSYHSFIAVMAFFRIPGFVYRDVSTFENEGFWNDED